MNRKVMLLAAIMAAPVLVSSCVTSGPTRNFKPVPAGYLYEGSYINVRAPNSNGWHKLKRAAGGIEFAKHGANPGESFGAQLLMFPLPPTKNKHEFLSLIKRNFSNNTDTKRFKKIESEFKYVPVRRYSCVSAVYVLEDSRARTSPTRREVLLLQVHALYCRHPVRKDTGFSIAFSHRGKSKYLNLAKEAQSFIDGVQVPKY